MKRNVSLEEISDGRLYGSNDMVKADCRGCKGCASCCIGMGDSVKLDPYDVYRLQKGLNRELRQLLAEDKVELNVVDGVILPNLKMGGEGERCMFLDEKNRCGIHEHRPGICRLFPLGRFYENGDFKYFLQTGECKAADRSKVKVSKWIDTPEQNKYHDFICEWHYFLNRLEAMTAGQELETGKRLNMLLLQIFYIEPYETGVEWNFYRQFADRMEQFKNTMGDMDAEQIATCGS